MGKLLCLFLLLAFGVQARTWTSADGRKVEAELKKYDLDADLVVLVRKGGREFSLKLEQLSASDNEFLQSLEKERLEKEEALVQQKAKASEMAGTVLSYQSDGNYGLGYHCYYPKGYVGDKMPVLILFSPGGNGRGIMNHFKKAGDEFGWLIVGCDKFKNNLDEGLCENWFREVLPSIEKNIPLNPNRMYMGGMSGGAWRAYHYSAMFDRPWKGIIACGGWLGGAKYDGMKYRRKMAVAMINGDNDNGANGWIDRDTSELKGRSCKIEVFHFPGGHVLAPPEVLEEAIEWVINNTRDR